jgi:hypothetical protein
VWPADKRQCGIVALSQKKFVHYCYMAFIENEERGKVDRKWGKIYSYST